MKYPNKLLLLTIVAAFSILSSANAQEQSSSTKNYSDVSCNECMRATHRGQVANCRHCIPPYLGIKDVSCKQWNEDSQSKGQAFDKDTLWLFGFISGYNAFAPGTLGNPKPTFFPYDEQALLNVVDENCRKTPNQSIIRVVMEFMDSLKHHSAE